MADKQTKKKEELPNKGDLAKDHESSIEVMNLIATEVINSPCCDEDEEAGQGLKLNGEGIQK